MPSRKIILTAISSCIILLFFLLPANREWLSKRIFAYYKEFPKQVNNTGLEYRKITRYENSYVQSRLIAQALVKKQSPRNILLLMPSSDYFKKNGLDYPVPEPAVFYYFTELKTVSPFSKEAMKANWYLRMENKAFVLDSVDSRLELITAIRNFQKYRP